MKNKKGWTVAEAVKALRKGDKKARIDIATQLPLFATATDEEILDAVEIPASQIEGKLCKGKPTTKKKVKKIKKGKKIKKVKDKVIEEDDYSDLFDDE